MINNGDIWDIGQTVNGVSRFLYLDSKWYYAVGYEKEIFKSELYGYDGDELTKLIKEDYDDETTFIGNIFINDMGLDFSECPEVLRALREYKLNSIINSDKI